MTRTRLRGVNPGGRNAPAQDLPGTRGSCTRYKLGRNPRSRKEDREKSGNKARILGRECPLDLGLFARPPTRGKRSLLRHRRPSAPASGYWAFGMLLREIRQQEQSARLIEEGSSLPPSTLSSRQMVSETVSPKRPRTHFCQLHLSARGACRGTQRASNPKP